MPDVNVSVLDAIKANSDIASVGKFDLFPSMLRALQDIRRELRLTNYLLSIGLNIGDDLDSIRNDPAQFADDIF